MPEDPKKKQARQARYDATEKGRARHARYRGSARGRETIQRNNERRLIVGGMYFGMVGFTKQQCEELLERARVVHGLTEVAS